MTIFETAKNIMDMLLQAGHEAYFVGGCVRDTVRGTDVHDWDITTSATPEEIAAIVPTTDFVGKNFGVCIVHLNGHTVEVATFRTDGAYSDNRRPDSVMFTKNVLEDLKRRDFTINAMLMDHTGHIIDPEHGQDDLKNGLLRCVGNAEERFTEDALRILRAVRFACKYGLQIEANTTAAIHKCAHRLSSLSAERIGGEFSKILTTCQNARAAIELMNNLDLLNKVIPELLLLKGVTQNPKHHPEGDVWNHTLQLLEHHKVENGLVIALAALLHDIAKPATANINVKTGYNQFYGHEVVGAGMAAKILRRLKMPNEVSEPVVELVRQHMKFFNVQQMGSAKLKRFVRQPFFDQLLELHRLDTMGSDKNLADYDFCVNFLSTVNTTELNPAKLLTGNDLRELGFTPGPHFRVLLNAVEDAQLSGQISTREEAVALVNALA